VIEPFREPPPRDVDLAFWREHLAGAGERSRALSMTEPGEGDDYRGQQVIRPVPAATAAKLESVSRELNASAGVVLLSAYYLLLANHGAGDDLVVGMPLDTRTPDRRDSIGYHVNVVGLRGRPDLAMAFREWVRVVRDNFLNGLRHVRASIDESVPGSYDTASNWREPIMRYMFNYSPYGSGPSARFGIQVIPVQLGYSRVDLTFNVLPRDEDLLIVASYRDQRFPPVVVDRLVERYVTLLDACLADLELPLRDYPLWSATDRASLSAPTVDSVALSGGLASVDAATLSVRDATGRVLPVGVWGELYHGDSGTGSVARWGWTGSLEFAPSSSAPPPVPAENTEGGEQRAASLGDAAIETILVDLWRELLDQPDSDEHTHFFRAGGTSLKAARIVAGIRNKLGVTVKLRQVFATPTPAELAAAISSSADGPR
jgi:acyl carrier protein